MNNWEEQVAHWASQFEYPPTPDLSRMSVRPQPAQPRPRLAWALFIILALLASLLLVPAVRATAVAIIRAGAVTIFVGEQPTPIATPVGIQVPAEFMTEISLAEALEREPDLQIPAGYGPPDQIFVHEGSNLDFIVMVWLAPDGAAADYALYRLEAWQYVYKSTSYFQETEVNGGQAFWVDSPHYFRIDDKDSAWAFIDSNVLVWWSSRITYRFESHLSLQEAIQAAESLVPLQEELSDE